MFKFTTTTIINNDVDAATGTKRIIPGTKDSSAHTPGNGIEKDSVLIKRLGLFKLSDILDIFTRAAEPETLSTASIPVPAPQKGDIYRIALYIGLTNSQNSYYANDFVFKGKPLFVEAKAPDSSAAKLIGALVSNAKKFITMVYEKELVTLKDNTSTLDISAINGNQVFKKVELQHWVPDLNNTALGEWEVLKETKDCNVVAGNPGFGTYSDLIHNVILPTRENTRFGSPAASDIPVVGGQYTQFIIRMCTNRGIMGGDAVGEVTKSVTEHVIWAEKNVATTLKNALDALKKSVAIDSSLQTKEEPTKPLKAAAKTELP